MKDSTADELREVHTKSAKYFLDLSISLLARLYALKHLADGVNYPPDKKTIDYASDSIGILMGSLESEIQQSENDLSEFLFYGIEKLSNITLKKIESFDEIIKYCLFVRKLFLSFNRYDNLMDSIEVLDQMKSIANQTDKRAAEFIAYWDSNAEKKMASLPGSQAKTEKYLERLNTFKNEVEKKGQNTDQGIAISRKDYDQIFQKIEIYTDNPKRKYRKEAEKYFGKKIIFRK